MSHSLTIALACRKVLIFFQSISARRVMGDVTVKLELVWEIKDTSLFYSSFTSTDFHSVFKRPSDKETK